VTEVKQGHTYMLGKQKVMAMDNGPNPLVYAVTGDVWPLRYLYRVNAEKLRPLPMVYFGGVVP
jgi:hypothetical protein